MFFCVFYLLLECAIKYIIAVCPVLLKLKRDDKVYIKEIISDLEDVIVQSYSSEATFDSFKGSWIKRIGTCAALLKLKLVSDEILFFSYFG